MAASLVLLVLLYKGLFLALELIVARSVTAQRLRHHLRAKPVRCMPLLDIRPGIVAVEPCLEILEVSKLHQTTILSALLKRRA